MPKPKKKPRPAAPPAPEFLPPQPSAEGVRKLRALYRERDGEETTEDAARDVLSRIMRFQYLNILTNMPAHGVQDGGESGADGPEGLEREHEEITGKPGAAEANAGGEAGAGRARGTAAVGVLREPG